MGERIRQRDCGGGNDPTGIESIKNGYILGVS
jgi:hypothetical protein